MAIRGPFQRPSLSFCVFLLFVFGFSFAKIVLVVLKKIEVRLGRVECFDSNFAVKAKSIKLTLIKNGIILFSFPRFPTKTFGSSPLMFVKLRKLRFKSFSLISAKVLFLVSCNASLSMSDRA